jgi:hypothetical protein
LGLELSNARSSICWIFVLLFDEAHNPKVVSSNLTPATKLLLQKELRLSPQPSELVVFVRRCTSNQMSGNFLFARYLSAIGYDQQLFQGCFPGGADTLQGVAGRLRRRRKRSGSPFS